MKFSIFLSSVLLFSMSAYADNSHTAEGKIEELTSYLETHSTSGVHDVVDFKLNVALAPPCTRVYLSKQETAAVSMLLSAKAREEKIKVFYYSDKVGPWSSTNCQVYAIREM